MRHLRGARDTYEAGGAQLVRVCDGARLPKGDRTAIHWLQTFGGEAYEIRNVVDPANPVRVARLDGQKDTHKNWWECDTGIAYLVSGAPDWRVRIVDRANTTHILNGEARAVAGLK